MKDAAVEAAADEIRKQGARYPRASAKLVLKALKAAGYAVVKLPEPEALVGGLVQASWKVGNISVDIMGGNVLWPTGYTKTPGVDTHNGCTPEWARKLAAAILAAADAAENGPGVVS